MENIRCQKSKIYAIKNHIDNDVYIGSTFETLQQRFSRHKWDCKRLHWNTPLYPKMLEYGFDKFYIELMLDYPCNSLLELRAKEGEYIRQYGTLNKLIAGRDKNQYALEHKEEKKQYDKKRYEEQKDQLAEQNKQNYIKNRDSRLQQAKEYRDKNKEAVYSRAAEKIECSICGSCVRRGDMSDHRRSKKCQAALLSKSPEQ